ncbi:MAG TPA: response regulator transcription factor [Terriglobales bacterium]|nr:response regulator transcription factor [Terriglobales bacterium]
MPRTRIVVIEDDAKTAEIVRLYLEHAGFEVLLAAAAREGLRLAEAAPAPDLIVLDRMLPGMDGLEVLRRVRERSLVPVILLTARTTEADRLEGLDLGADDYVSKPFSPRELVARVRAVLRRQPAGERERPAFEAGGLRIDPARLEVRVRGQRVALTPHEFRLLETLARAPGRVFRRDELIARAFGHEYAALDRTVDAHVANLRRKLEKDPSRPKRIRTVFGVGYRFAEDPGAP